jgi:hypothetical protein
MGGLLIPRRPALLAPSRRMFLRGLTTGMGLVAAGSASAMFMHGAAGGGGSYIDIANPTALFAMLNAGVGASGGKSYRLANTDFGTLGIYNYDFTANPILIQGQSGTTVTWLDTAGSSGLTWSGIRFTGYNPSNGGWSVFVHSDDGVSRNDFALIDFITDSGNSEGNQTGNGVGVRNVNNSTIVIQGQGVFAQTNIQGRGTGIGIADSGAGGTILVKGVTAHNIAANGIVIAGSSNVTTNGNLIYDQHYMIGEHPNGIHCYSTANGPCQNIVHINNFIWQGTNGMGPAGIFHEDVATATVRYNAVLSGGQDNAFSNARGSGQTNDNNFAQGVMTDMLGGDMIARGMAVNSINTNNEVGALNNYAADGVNPGYVPASGLGSNSLIPSAASVTDFTYLNPWWAAHPTARTLN